MPDGTPTPFISVQEPTPLTHWVRGEPAVAQTHPSLPRTFLDAMEVREEVYVAEQGVPLANELDEDDSRSCHWVVYASVHRVVAPERHDSRTGDVVAPRRSETRTTPIGTVRLVPFPHPPHPRHGGEYVDGRLTNAGAEVPAPETAGGSAASGGAGSGSGASAGAGGEVRVVAPLTAVEEQRLNSALPFGDDRATDMHDGREPYVKLGRLAVVKEFRGQGIASLLVRTALGWMRQHPARFNPGVAALGLEQLGMDRGGGAMPKWDGLVCCHAQESVVGAWEKCGFKIDKGMGRWLEEGIPHVGMFVRLEIPPEAAAAV